MKNLRKVLALVLAVATLMSFAAMANAAFTDVDKVGVNNKEAIDLLTALKIVKGKGTEETFAPDDNVTRAEMAKMIYVILKKGTDDEGKLYTGGTMFADVAASDWAKGYVEYIGKQGIISGRANGNFDPKANVKGVEAAKMLLGVLGYDAQTEGYQSNESWFVNIVDRAEEIGLFAGTSAAADPDVVLTRENAARMILNALEATMVKYNQKGASITVNGITFVTGAGEPEEVTKEGATVELIEKYFADVTKNEDYVDALGRPGVQYKKGTKVLCTTMETPLIKKENGTVSTKEVLEKTGEIAKDLASKTSFYINGTTGSLATNAKKAFTDSKNDTTFKTFGTKGAVTEFFWNEELQEGSVVIYTERLGIVSAVSSDKKTVTINSWDQSKTDYIGSEIATKTYTSASSLKKGDLVAYIRGTDWVSIEKAELKRVVAKGGVTYNSSGTIVMSTLYTSEGNMTGGYHNHWHAANWNFGSTYDLALNSFGSVLGGKKVIAAAEEAKYLYVLDTAVEATSFGDATYLAKVLMADGTIEIVETNKDYAKATGMYSYTVAKEVYTLTAVDLDAARVTSITQGKASFSSDALATDMYFNNDTLFIVETTVGSEKVYNTYTGIRNVPSMTGEFYYAHKDNLVSVLFAMNATEQTVEASTELDVSVLYVPSYKELEGKITKEDANGDAYSYYTVKAIINGTVTTVDIDETVYAQLKCDYAQHKNADGENVDHGAETCFTVVEGLAFIDSYKQDANGIICEVTEASLETITMKKIGTATKFYNKGVIDAKIGSGAQGKVSIDASVSAFIFDIKDKKFEVKTVADLSVANFQGYVLVEDGEIVAFYGIDKEI